MIVQLGPFERLMVADRMAFRGNVHLNPQAVDRSLMAHADACLVRGEYEEAEIGYRRCLNYYPMPEPALRLALCRLYLGDARSAGEMLWNGIESMLERSGPRAEPDPTEWGYWLVTLLCQGRLRDALRGAKQYPLLRNEHVDRARWLIHVAAGEPEPSLGGGTERASIHVFPSSTREVWLSRVTGMLVACGQKETAGKIREVASASPTPSATTTGSDTTRGTVQQTPLIHRLEAARGKEYRQPDGIHLRRVWRGIKRRIWVGALRILNVVERIVGPFLPLEWSFLNADEHVVRIRRLFSVEGILQVVIIGAGRSSWLTEAVFAGVAKNPRLPKVVWVDVDSRWLRRFEAHVLGNRRLECHVCDESEWLSIPATSTNAMVINCSAMIARTSPAWLPEAGLICMISIASPWGSEVFRRLVASRRYMLIANEPDCGLGYAVFRRRVEGNEIRGGSTLNAVGE